MVRSTLKMQFFIENRPQATSNTRHGFSIQNWRKKINDRGQCQGEKK